MQGETKYIQVQVVRKLPGTLKAGVWAIICVGIYYSIGNFISAGGYVLAALLLWLYATMEGTAVEYFNKFTLLKTLIEIKHLEIDGTLDDEVSLTTYEEENNDETSTE